MQKGKQESILFRAILFIIVVMILEGIGFIGMWVNSRSTDYLGNKSYFQIRAMLMGDKNSEHSPRFLSLPYLGYIPYPGYERNGLVQNNEDGYRGAKVPLAKSDKFRILCMGGSTTYGSGVALPGEAYPAQLQILVNNYIIHDTLLGRKYSGAEVINAGLEGGNSAEELQQYLFKYRYYHPDAVVISSGINDALLLCHDSEFQLDYTRYRRINFHLEPLPPPMRWLLKSNFISFFAIRFFYNDFAEPGDEFMPKGHQTFSNWSHLNVDTIISRKQYSYYPFYQNSSALYHAVIQDSSYLVVLPNILNRNSDFVKSNSKYNGLCNLNMDVSKSLSDKLGGFYVPFNFESIKDTASWIDDCHIDAKGEKEKAQAILPVIINVLNSNFRGK